MEDHDIFLETKLDDDNIAIIGRVLEIEAQELVFLVLKPCLQHGKKTLHLVAFVRVHNIKIGRAMCEHLPVTSDWIHGGWWRMGKRLVGRRREESEGDE